MRTCMRGIVVTYKGEIYKGWISVGRKYVYVYFSGEKYKLNISDVKEVFYPKIGEAE